MATTDLIEESQQAPFHVHFDLHCLSEDADRSPHDTTRSMPSKLQRRKPLFNIRYAQSTAVAHVDADRCVQNTAMRDETIPAW